MYKKFNLLAAVLLVSSVVFISCSRDEDKAITETPDLQTKTYTNLFAPQGGGQGQPTSGDFAKFSLAKNAVVTDDSWDIAFRGTTVIVNGGSKIGIADEPERVGNAAVSPLMTAFSAVKTVPASSAFKQDAAQTYAIETGAGNGWYNYNQANNIITPIPGKVFVIRTHTGKYAKLEVISYYKDAPASPDANSVSRYFTLKYAYQSEGTSF